MSRELCVHAVHKGGMHFEAGTAEHKVDLDYPLQPGDTAGLTPLEMLLASLASCAGSTVALLLERMHAPLTALEVEARATRRETHPTVLTDVVLEFVAEGGGLDPQAVGRAIQIAEEQLCPVWAMLKGATTIHSSFRLVGA